jgi:hypothetical protein
MTENSSPQFKATNDGMRTRLNVIDYTTGVQVWQMASDALFCPDLFYVGVPASARNTGVRAVHWVDTLEEALTIAAEMSPAAARSMARKHAEALRMNKAGN